MKLIISIVIFLICAGFVKAAQCPTCCKDIQAIKEMLSDFISSSNHNAVNKTPPPLKRDLPYMALPPEASSVSSNTPPELARKGTDGRSMSSADFLP